MKKERGKEMEPGEQLFNQLVSGKVDGRKIGNFIFSLLPAMPHEGPPMPRFVAKRMYPRGFVPGQLFPAVVPARPATPGIIPPAGLPAALPAAQPSLDARGNLIQRTQAMPQPAEVIQRTNQGRQPAASRPTRGIVDQDPGKPKTIRIHPVERRGVM